MTCQADKPPIQNAFYHNFPTHCKEDNCEGRAHQLKYVESRAEDLKKLLNSLDLGKIDFTLLAGPVGVDGSDFKPQRDPSDGEDNHVEDVDDEDANHIEDLEYEDDDSDEEGDDHDLVSPLAKNFENSMVCFLSRK